MNVDQSEDCWIDGCSDEDERIWCEDLVFSCPGFQWL